MLCNAVRVGGALSTTVDGAATVGLSTTIIESSGATSLNIADIQLQSTGRLDSSIAEDASFGMQGVQVRIIYHVLACCHPLNPAFSLHWSEHSARYFGGSS